MGTTVSTTALCWPLSPLLRWLGGRVGSGGSLDDSVLLLYDTGIIGRTSTLVRVSRCTFITIIDVHRGSPGTVTVEPEAVPSSAQAVSGVCYSVYPSSPTMSFLATIIVYEFGGGESYDI